MNFIDLYSQHAPLEKRLIAAMQRVMRGGEYILGREVATFENTMASLTATRHAIGVNSATDGLYFVFRALGLSSGDEVITTPYTVMPTIEGLLLCGAKPVFVDVDPETYCIDHTKIEAAITKKTKAILPVHIFGHAAEMATIMRIAKKYSLAVVEDVAQATGGMYNGRPLGSFGVAGVFSFFPTKNLGALGDGGMVVTNTAQLAADVRVLRSHGAKKKYINEVLGNNSRLDALQAAILQIKVSKLAAWNAARSRAALRYTKALSMLSAVQTPITAPKVTHVYHQYTIRVRQRDALQSFLASQNIPTMVYYPKPLHRLPVLRSLQYDRGSFPVAEQLSTALISLPLYPGIPATDQQKVIKAIQQFYS